MCRQRSFARAHEIAKVRPETPFRTANAGRPGRLVPAATITKLHSDLERLAEKGEHLSDWKRAVLFRDALILAVLSVTPNRARTVAAMAIGTTLQRRGNERWVAFGPLDMKNKRPFAAPLPGLAPMIERYIEHYRPFLVARSIPRPAGDALWISSNGRPLSSMIIGLLVRRRTEREFGRGRHLNPHLFRKIVPTELAINDPEHVGVAQPLLGHTNHRMTERAYNLGRAIDAARRHQDVIRAIRAADTGAGRRAGRSEASTRQRGRPRLGTRNNSKKG
jgi:integrase/recombinase XerD